MSNIPENPQKNNDSNSDFEARMKARRKRILAANSHRRFQCVACGERYDYEWVYEYGTRCHVECDMELVEVRNG